MARLEAFCDECEEDIIVDVDVDQIYDAIDSFEMDELLNMLGVPDCECPSCMDSNNTNYGITGDDFDEAVRSLMQNRLLLTAEEEELILKLGKKVR